MLEPHGGTLVNRMVDEETHKSRYDDFSALPTIELNERQYQDAINISTGRYSPLKGFMARDDFLKVVHDVTLEDGTVWPLPVVLDVDSDIAANLEPDDTAALLDPVERVFALIEVQEVYKANKQDAVEHIFGTSDENHPGVDNFLNTGDFFIAGPIKVFEGERYNDHDLHPVESRVLFEQYEWEKVVGFQTRNAPHRGHEYIQKCALERTDGLLVQPKLGEKKTGDYTDDVILDAYEKLVDNYYPEGHVTLSVFPSQMRYAGPREAIFDALIRKNQGCTHFIIGRDHAGVGDYYDSDAAHRIFEKVGDIGIKLMMFDHAFYCYSCDGMGSERTCPHDDDERAYPSGSKIRRLISESERPSEKIMRPEIATFIIETDQPFVEK